MYAARAASTLKDRAVLDKLADDEEDNVREAAVDGLAKIAGHDADAVYVRQLTRKGHQVLRVAAAVLAGTQDPDAAVPALKTVHQRLVAEGHDNSHDARAAIEKTLATLGSQARVGLQSGSSQAEVRLKSGLIRLVTIGLWFTSSARTRDRTRKPPVTIISGGTSRSSTST